MKLLFCGNAIITHNYFLDPCHYSKTYLTLIDVDFTRMSSKTGYASTSKIVYAILTGSAILAWILAINFTFIDVNFAGLS